MGFYDKLREGAKGTALPTAELVGQLFIIESVRSVNTEFGQRWIANIFWPPEATETQEAWMSGAQLSRQIQAIKDDLPGDLVTLTRDSEPNSPYILEPPSETVKGETSMSYDQLFQFRNEQGKVDGAKFVLWWQKQGVGPKELAEIIGEVTVKALHTWFDTHPRATLQDLVAEARGEDAEEEMPFE